MRMFREVLLNRGFDFCDEGQPQHPDDPPPADPTLRPLLASGLAASSTDHDSQSIGCTLDASDQTFWSSTGSRGPEVDEWLLYRLAGPLCAVRFLRLTVFRASFQFGEPVYPPAFISVQVGPSPRSLLPPTVKYAVRPTHETQTFALPASLPVGRFLKLTLHGKRQRQLDDLAFYHAIQGVGALGDVLTPCQVMRLRDWLTAQPVPSAADGGVPAHAVASLLGLRPAPEEEQDAGGGGGSWRRGGGRGEEGGEQRRGSSQWDEVLRRLARQQSPGYSSDEGSFVG
eukprot:scaffold2.g7163.t1